MKRKKKGSNKTIEREKGGKQEVREDEVKKKNK